MDIDTEKDVFVLVHDNNYSTQVDVKVFAQEEDAKTGLTIALTQKETDIASEDIVPKMFRTANGWYATLYVPSKKNNKRNDRLPDEKWDSDEWTIVKMKQKDLIPDTVEYD